MTRFRDGSPFASRRWTEQDAQEVLAAQERSGVGVAAFAAQHGLDPQRLYSWRRRVAVGDRITFREVVVAAEAVAPQQAPFEVVFATGLVVRVPPAFDQVALGQLLEVIRAC